MRVSVIIPTHNRSFNVTKALESVMSQTYTNLEIIVVSDGSEDDTDQVISSYQRVDKRIKYISYHPNKGSNYARNKGIQESNGDYLAFLDDDDEWLPKKIEMQLLKFKENPNIGLVYTSAEIIYDDLKLSYFTHPTKEGDLSSEILMGNCIGSTSTVMLKKSVLEEVGNFDEALSARQDYDLWLRVCQKYEVGLVREPLIKYHNINNVKQISDNTEKYKESVLYINEKYAKQILNLSDKKQIQRKQSNYLLLVKRNMRNRNSKEARRYLYKAFRVKPTLSIIKYFLMTFFKYSTLLKLRAIKK